MENNDQLSDADIQEVKKFWSSNPCQSTLSTKEERRDYFDEIEGERYKHEPHIPLVARFSEYQGCEMMEIGCSIATDGLQFARAGAKYLGVDLTEAGIAIARERFAIYGVEGEFKAVNAEKMPFEDNTFDHVYSFGVIHHSPNTEAIVAEIRRVLKPGGTVRVMVYNRSSINYYIEIMFLRKLFRLMLFPAFMPRLLSKLTGFRESKLQGHRQLLVERGKMSKADWISVNTDGPTCPLAKVYNAREGRELFKDFAEVEFEVRFFDKRHWPGLNKLMPKSFVSWLGRKWGWHRMIHARKSAAG